jgi:hypothetical protein
MKLIILIISMMSVSCGTEVMAEPEQQIILQEGENPIIIQSDPEDEVSNTYIYQEGEKPIVCTPTGDSGMYCL